MKTFKHWWKNKKLEYSYGEPTAEEIAKELWKMTLKANKEPVAKLQFERGEPVRCNAWLDLLLRIKTFFILFHFGA